VRVVFDTTVWVAAFRSRQAASGARLIRDACVHGHVHPVLSRPVLHEAIEVLLRPELGLDAADVLTFGLFLAQHGTFVRITRRPQGCRDPKDDMFLETARVGEAQMLVTFDNDLLALDLVERLLAEGIRVLSIGDFVRELREAGIVVDASVIIKQTP
jgi:putative PIN family toxin of toxin-antitoxin system